MTTPGGEGRFDGYDVLGQADHWDPVTRRVVLGRLDLGAPLAFFTDEEAAIAGALLDRLLGQDEDPKVDVLGEIDHRLALDVTDGWRYADMPHDRQAWQQTLRHLDDDCRERFGVGFAAATRTQQMAVVQSVQDRTGEDWHGLPARHVWSLWTRYACTAFYGHPWSWNEIGFGGPAYPRGYKNIGLDRREPWEQPERDAHDPVPWVRRTEDARRAHLERLGRDG